MKDRKTKLALAFLVLALIPGVARSQSTKKDAERFFRAGETAYQKGQYGVAAEAFEKAYELFPKPAIGFSAAQAHRLEYFKGKKPESLKRAVDLYRSYLRAVPQGGRSIDATTGLSELEPILLRLEASGATIGGIAKSSATRMMISSQVDGAVVSLDGGKETTVPVVSDVQPGKRRVVVTAKGYYPVDKTYVVVEGQFRAVEVELKAKPAEVRLTGRKGAKLRLDGRLVGTLPLAKPLELPAGSHQLSTTKRGRKAWNRDVSLNRGDIIDLQAEQPITAQRVASYAVLGSAGAVLLGSGAAAFLASKSNSKAVAIESRRQSGTLSLAELDELSGHVQKRDERVNLAKVLLGVGVGLAAGGAALYYFDNPSVEERAPEPAVPRLSLVPVLDDEQAGMAVVGAF